MSEQCHTSCNGQCSSCEVEEMSCPVCGKVGFYVPFETVESLIQPDKKEQLKEYKNDEFNICLNKACQVSYYTQNDYLKLEDITVPIWFKKQKSKYMVCYCRDITLSDIIDAVNHLNKADILIQDVVNYLHKEEIKTDCLHHNPTGICCDQLFQNAIEYAKQKK